MRASTLILWVASAALATWALTVQMQRPSAHWTTKTVGHQVIRTNSADGTTEVFLPSAGWVNVESLVTPPAPSPTPKFVPPPPSSLDPGQLPPKVLTKSYLEWRETADGPPIRRPLVTTPPTPD